MVVFVPFTIPGERIEAELVRKKKNYAEGRLVTVESASPNRVEPVCPYFGHCGGCSYQHIDYPAQVVLKTSQVEQTLRRVGKLTEVPMRPTVASPRPYSYRNRIRVHVVEGMIGFFALDGHTLVDVTRCPIASDEVNARLAGFRSRRMPDGDYTLAEQREKGYFEQTNNAVARAMLETAERLIEKGGTLVDAYCGAGFFAHGLSAHFEQVIGIEENEIAVQHARADAGPNGRYQAGDVDAILPEALDEACRAGATSLVLDPPAAGITARVIDAVLAAKPREVVYVSCNPGTLARDLNALCRGYRLESVTALDMFPQTAEIEVVTHLRRV